MRKTMIRTAAALSLLALPMGGIALAQSAAPATTPATAPAGAPTGPAMGMSQIVDHLSAQGYKDIREVERKSDKLFEVKATNPQGQRQELVLDARTGEILKAERD